MCVKEFYTVDFPWLLSESTLNYVVFFGFLGLQTEGRKKKNNVKTM